MATIRNEESGKMAKYTQRGSEALDAKIDADLEIIRTTVAPHCDAIILLGGYGRGEGTPLIQPDGSQAPFNDYDLVVIVKTISIHIRLLFQRLEKELTEKIGLPVDLCPYARHALSSREFSLLNYEMKHGHMVIWGADDVLDALPNYATATIPVSEGTRLLMNRGKLLLDIKRRLATAKPLNEEERICFIKFINKVLLAFGDAALIAAGKYHISYTEKKQRISTIGQMPDRDFIIAGYLGAIEIKEWGAYQSLVDYDLEQQLAKTIEVFIHFLPWYRKQYAIRECSIPKAIALNLKWNATLSARHPRELLYDALGDLLQDQSSMSHERFYELQKRFS
jgi:predicted nucleotidyltransferase